MTPLKRIVVLSDGTGNSSAKLMKTNVWRMYEGVDLSTGDQVALYDNGVGNSSFKPLAFLGGALGWGLKRNVLRLYAFICHNYDRGTLPEIYAFGFSRGAFTIRVLIDLIHDQGLITHAKGQELERQARWAYRQYRRRYNTTGGLVNPLRTLRDWLWRLWERKPAYDATRNTRARITFVGLWDTVDAYGLPIDEMTRGWDEWVWPLSFRDQQCPASVDKVCHAMALDDERHTFHPVLFDETQERVFEVPNGEQAGPCIAPPGRIDDERVTQVWFSGVHSNIGGGYPDDALAMVPLLWIAGQARHAGLRLHQPILNNWEACADPNGPMSDSRRGLGAYYRYNPRSIKKLTDDRFASVHIPLPKIHESVFDRIAAGRDDYAPIVLPEQYAVVTSSGSILPTGNHSRETASQSLSRCADQERVWNLVWKRRIAYFATVILTLMVAAPPLIFSPGEGALLTWKPVGLSGLVQALGELLPGMAKPWVDYYHEFPVQLVVGAVIITILLGISTRLQQSMQDDMRRLWDVIVQNPGKKVTPSVPPNDWVYLLRSHHAYRTFFETVTQRIFPLVFGLAALLAIVLIVTGTVNRGLFAIASASGSVCRDADATSWDRSIPLSFHSNEICHATGIELHEGARYRLTVQSLTGWFDDSIPVASAAGFSSGEKPAVFVPFLPFRRILTAQWFVPIARIGAHTAEYHHLDQGTAEFVPRHSGQLFFFVNDAVGPASRFGWLYENNFGTADVLLEELQSP